MRNLPQNSNIIVGTGSGTNNSCVFVDHLQELTNHKRDRLNSLHLFLSTKKLTLQILLFIFDVCFL